jgi:hypothetical protein
MSVYKMFFIQMTVNEISINEMSFGQIFVDQMSFGQIFVDQMSFWPNVFRPKDMKPWKSNYLPVNFYFISPKVSPIKPFTKLSTTMSNETVLCTSLFAYLILIQYLRSRHFLKKKIIKRFYDFCPKPNFFSVSSELNLIWQNLGFFAKLWSMLARWYKTFLPLI